MSQDQDSPTFVTDSLIQPGVHDGLAGDHPSIPAAVLSSDMFKDSLPLIVALPNSQYAVSEVLSNEWRRHQ